MQKGPSKSIKFCIATDVHLGHKQNHSIRKNDSFNAFEQVLSIATEEKADFVLLGGDLFDEVNPSQKTIYKCLDILQHYVQGEGQKNLKARWIDNPDYKINFQNHNMNIKLPIFTIHGNHDYPSNDFGKISICDLLHVSNYANYFGKHTNLSQIVIKPVIVEKQGLKTKIAIYGLGYIKDNVLNDLFEAKKVKFLELQNREEYFCLFVFHQNRYKKGLRPGAPALKCINSKHIPTWMDLTIWGHEHEAINKIEIQDQRKIFQPGSTVITSFIEAQAYPKQSLMIEIMQSGSIDLTPVPLTKSYRPMVCRNLQISLLVKQHKKTSTEEFDFFSYLDNYLNKIIEDIEKQFPGRKPIIRIKVEHSGYEISRWRIVEVKYLDKVANPESIMSFWKRKEEKVEQPNLLQALVSKTNLSGDGQQQVGQQILQLYTQTQQNKQCYFDPRQLYKYHQTSISKDLINAKDYLSGYVKRQIEKRTKPTKNQLQSIYKTIKKEVDLPAHKLLADIKEVLTFDFKDDKNGNDSVDVKDLGDAKIYIAWESQRQLLTLKQDEITKSTLTQNYGDHFFVEDIKPKSNSTKMQIEEQGDERRKGQMMPQRKKEKLQCGSASSSLFDWIKSSQSSTSNNKPAPQKMQIQQPSPFPASTSTRPSPSLLIPPLPSHPHPHRPGILKKPTSANNISSQSNNHSQEEDCCKRAQRTEYNELMVKQNFDGADRLVKDGSNNGEKRNKKDAKEKEKGKIVEKKKKKSVKWSDSEDFQ